MKKKKMSVDMARLPPDEIVMQYQREHERAFPNKPVSDFDILQFKDDFIYRRKEALVTYGADMYYKEEMIRFIETMKKIADNPETPLHLIYAEVLANYAKSICVDDVQELQDDYEQAWWRAFIASEYLKIADMIKNEKYIEAVNLHRSMDTMERDEIPDDVFLFLKEKFLEIENGS